ncbi:hypothetical protein MBEBAB_0456 [Brevundimonas abyssalis TAR-001]|uniref:Uncharacterized protein n=2 Tax=Brevundimonas TaxID=41275 RepID=A0A8E0KHD1_9CAUL|nr:hypothetical protein MBEBAB_0456 [Brevundimonas abyssalis TAR-001]
MEGPVMGMKVKLGVVVGVAVLGLSACGREDPAVSEPAGGEPADAPETAEAAPQAQPVLRDGLWVVASETDGMRSAMRMCVDAEVQARMGVLGSQMSGGACEESTVTPRPAGAGPSDRSATWDRAGAWSARASPPAT